MLIRTLLSQGLESDWIRKQLDIPTAFLNKELQSEIYIICSKGVIAKGPVFKFKRV